MEYISMHAAASAMGIEDWELIGQERIPERMKSALEGKSDLLGTLAVLPSYLFHAYRLERADQQRLLAGMQFLLQTYQATVQLCISKAITKVVRFGKEEIPHSTLDDLQEGIISWLQGYYYALIARAENFHGYLKGAEVEEWMVFEGPLSPFFQAHHRFLVELGGENDVAHLDAVEKGLALIPAAYRTGLEIYFPLWRPIIEKDQAGFDVELRAALERHLAYWGQPQADRPEHPKNPDGHFSYQITAMMAYALDQGLHVNVGSGYTPLELVRGDLKVDVDTELDFYF